MIQENFLNELFNLSFSSEKVFKIVVSNLYDRDISKEDKAHKIILNELKKFNKKHGDILPTIGYIEQKVSKGGEYKLVFKRILQSKPDKEFILLELGEYLKSVRTEQAIYDFTEDYKSGGIEESLDKLVKNTKEINELTLENKAESSNPFNSLFDGTPDEISNKKVKFGIPKLDSIAYGGLSENDTALFIMRSGVGKSTLLKWVGFYASYLGNSVLHFQLEGSKKEVQNKYQQIITGNTYTEVRNMDYGVMKDKVVYDQCDLIVYDERSDYLQYLIGKMTYAKEKFNKFNIEVVSFEEFGMPNMSIVENKIKEYIEEFGKSPDLIIVDSLDLMHPGDGLNYGVDTFAIKMKMQNSSKIMKNLATKYKTRFVTATQADNVKFEEWNNEDFVIDRSRTAGDKSLANAFSFVVSGNRTIKEKKLGHLRFFIDKLRDYSGEGEVFSYHTDYDHGRALDLGKGLIEVETLKKKEGDS